MSLGSTAWLTFPLKRAMYNQSIEGSEVLQKNLFGFGFLAHKTFSAGSYQQDKIRPHCPPAPPCFIPSDTSSFLTACAVALSLFRPATSCTWLLTLNIRLKTKHLTPHHSSDTSSAQWPRAARGYRTEADRQHPLPHPRPASPMATPPPPFSPQPGAWRGSHLQPSVGRYGTGLCSGPPASIGV